MAANESSQLPERKKTHPDTDLKKLKSQYGPKLSTLRELFADWSDEDLIFALQEADGDLELTIDRISEGSLPPFHMKQFLQTYSNHTRLP
jgi:CUE domain